MNFPATTSQGTYMNQLSDVPQEVRDKNS